MANPQIQAIQWCHPAGVGERSGFNGTVSVKADEKALRDRVTGYAFATTHAFTVLELCI